MTDEQLQSQWLTNNEPSVVIDSKIELNTVEILKSIDKHKKLSQQRKLKTYPEATRINRKCYVTSEDETSYDYGI